MRRKKTLEIITLRNGKWSIEGTAGDLETAQTGALQLYDRPGVLGVRVIKESAKDINKPAPGAILFEKMRSTGKADRIVVGEYSGEGPVCETLEDLLDSESRQSINRLFRAYLDKNTVTATEVMHNAREMKKFMDFENMLPSAVLKVAQMQSRRENGPSPGERRDILFSLADQLSTRAKGAESLDLPSFAKIGINEAIEQLNQKADGGAAEYMFRVAASRDLVDIRNWWSKFAMLVDWAGACTSDPERACLDWFISDALGNTSVLQDLLGDQDSLADALICLIEIADGVRSIDEKKASDADTTEATAAKINLLFKDRQLPESRRTVMERVSRQLQGGGSLIREGAGEPEVFREMLHRLIPGTEVTGGPKMAEAITHRQSNIINQGGESGLKAATASVLPVLDDPGRKAGYLLTLMESDLGKELLMEEIEQHLNGLIIVPDSVQQIVRAGPPNKKMEKITSIFYRIRNSNLPDSRKEQLTQHLDELLASYVVDGKILDRLNDPDKPLHIRAFMLLSMCQPEMLPDGKASKLAREIIVNHLRRPNFETELVAQVPDAAKKEEILRNFHTQLHRSGYFQ